MSEGILVVIVAILAVFGLPLLIVVVIGAVILMIVKMVTGGSPRKTKAESTQETRLIQDIHNGLSRMEERIDALETLLVEQERKEMKNERQ